MTESADGDGDATVERASPPPDWLVRVVNPVVKLVLRSPLHGLVSDQLLLVTVTGRRSGREYTFPVGYERDGATVTVTSHGTNWWKNLRDGGGEVGVVLAGERRTGHAEVVEDDAAVAEHVHERLVRDGTGVARRMGLAIEGDAVPDVEMLREHVGHVVVVRIELDGG